MAWPDFLPWLEFAVVVVVGVALILVVSFLLFLSFGFRLDVDLFLKSLTECHDV